MKRRSQHQDVGGDSRTNQVKARRIRPKARRRTEGNSPAAPTFDRLDVRALLAVAALPDLFPWANSSYMGDYMISGDLLRFSTAFANKAAANSWGHLELRGGAVLANGNQEVLQRVFNTDGTFTDRSAGEFTYHSGHGHIHFDGYAIYRLRQVTAGNGVGDVVATGGKISFCLIDIAKYYSNAGTSRYGSCGTTQGVTAGWSDVYSRSLADQWINISLVPDGQYWLEVVVDPDNLLVESDETNNTTRILATINRGGNTGGDRWEPNSTFATATSLGTISHAHELGLSIHNAADTDYFRFTAAGTGEFHAHLNFSHQLGNLDLFLYNSSQQLITSSTGTTNSEDIHFNAVAGTTYFVRVDGVGSAVNAYDLELEGFGDVLNETVTASDLPVTIPDGLGPQGTTPGPWATSVIQGPLVQLTDLNLIFNQLEHAYLGDLEIQLTSPQGTTQKILTSQWQSGGGLMSGQDNLQNTFLDDQATTLLSAGTAPFLGAFRISHSNTATNPLAAFNGQNASGNWTLRIRDWYPADTGVLRKWSLMFTGLDLNPGDQYEPNNAFPQSVDLGMLGVVNVPDVTIHNSTDRDFYRFKAGVSGPVRIAANFTHADGNLDMRVYNSSLQTVFTGNSADDDEIFDFNATVNETYYVEVYGVLGAKNDYTLDVDVAPVIGQTGLIPDVTHLWTQVLFGRSYQNPVVVVSPATSDDLTAATVQTRNVTSTGFEVRISPWNYLANSHGPEDLGYLVVEAGNHTLPGGGLLNAGVEASVEGIGTRINVGPLSPTRPIVLAQVASQNGGRTAVARVGNSSSYSFSLRVQEQESQLPAAVTPQTVHWLTLNAGSDSAGSWRYQAGFVPTVTDAGATLNYSTSFTNLPILLAGVQTFNESDPVSIRTSALTAAQATVRLQEEQSLDAETSHIGERLGWLAFDGPFLFGPGGGSFLRSGGNGSGQLPGSDGDGDGSGLAFFYRDGQIQTGTVGGLVSDRNPVRDFSAKLAGEFSGKYERTAAAGTGKREVSAARPFAADSVFGAGVGENRSEKSGHGLDALPCDRVFADVELADGLT